MSHPIHHISIRKRIYQKKQKYPHPDRWINLLDRLVILFGMFNAVATLPQVLVIWIGHDAGGVSVFSWSYYVAAAALLLVYGIVHNDKPIIITYSISTVMYSVVVVGAIIFA